MKPIPFNIYGRNYTFTLGEEYKVGWRGNICKFIKVTPKGFNLLDLKTHKCILKKHLYSRAYVGKPIPSHHTKFKVRISTYMTVTPIKKAKTA